MEQFVEFLRGAVRSGVETRAFRAAREREEAAQEWVAGAESSHSEIGVGRLGRLLALQSWLSADTCNPGVLPPPQNVRLIDRPSATAFVLLLTYRKGAGLAFKMWFAPVNGASEAAKFFHLAYSNEARFYTEFLTPLVERGSTPHLLTALAYTECPDLVKALARLKHLDQNQVSSLAKMVNPKLSAAGRNPRDATLPVGRVLVTEVAPSATELHRAAEGMGTEDLLQIYVQLFYTLFVLDLSRVRHNDMHFGNVMVQRLEKPVTLAYVFGGQEVLFLKGVRFFALLYDWDNGSAPGIVPFERWVGMDPAQHGGNVWDLVMFTRNLVLEADVLGLLPLGEPSAQKFLDFYVSTLVPDAFARSRIEDAGLDWAFIQDVNLRFNLEGATVHNQASARVVDVPWYRTLLKHGFFADFRATPEALSDENVFAPTKELKQQFLTLFRASMFG